MRNDGHAWIITVGRSGQSTGGRHTAHPVAVAPLQSWSRPMRSQQTASPRGRETDSSSPCVETGAARRGLRVDSGATRASAPITSAAPRLGPANRQDARQRSGSRTVPIRSKIPHSASEHGEMRRTCLGVPMSTVGDGVLTTS
jgi:hypothetical protein